MIFFSWWRVCILAAPVLILVGAVWTFWLVRSAKRWILVTVRSLSVLLMALSLLFGLMGVAARLFGRITDYAPQYSADRRFAIQVEDLDEGAVGGQSVVGLYTGYGLRQAEVYLGNWKQVESRDVEWMGPREVRIRYHGEESPRVCKGAFAVVVKCEQALETVQH